MHGSAEHGPLINSNFRSIEGGPDDQRVISSIAHSVSGVLGGGGHLLENNTADDLERLGSMSEERLPNEEGGQSNDVEFIIMNLYSKMKNLENKYIDLANFYKQELVKTGGSNKKVPP